MAANSRLVFQSFQLDLVNEQLWRGTERLALRPKPFALLRYLAERPGRLVTKEELTKTVWPNTYVGESSLKGYIRDLREVLGDNPEAPQFIETVARRGYRFIAAVRKIESDARPSSSLLALPHALVPNMIGRERELEQLQQWYNKALHGERHVVFVTGEPGIGKTTLVEAFLAQWVATDEERIARGQCMEQYGPGEAYLPVLEALGRSCRQPGGERVIAVLRQYAPTWLVQMPALLADAEFDALQRKVQGATRERMLREMAEALDMLTIERPLIFVLEDLQWSDYSTLDLLTTVIQRRESARFLIIGTYRPTDVIVSGHPLKSIKQDLQGRRLWKELSLPLLSKEAISSYLALRFPHHQFPPELSQFLFRSTEGNPFYVVSIIDHLMAQKWLQEINGQWHLTARLSDMSLETPDSLRQLIERQIERLTIPQQRVLEVASVIGTEFSAETIAVGVGDSIEAVEECCEAVIQRRQFLYICGTELYADGTVTGRYGFLHALYRQVLYQRVPVLQRVRLHRRIGECLEGRYGGRVREIATELAMHFELGHDYEKAAQYLQQAAENALRRSAHGEAVDLLQKGVALLGKLSTTPKRIEQQLILHRLLIVALSATHGYASATVERVCTRTRELCDQLGQTPHLALVLSGLLRFHVVRAEYENARALGVRLLDLAQHVQDSLLLMEAHIWLGMIALNCGASQDARRHLEHGVALYDPQLHRDVVGLQGQDPGVSSLSLLAIALWRLGYYEQARTRSTEAITLAHTLEHPYSLEFALHHAALFLFLSRNEEESLRRIDEMRQLAQLHGLPMALAAVAIFQGIVRVRQGAVDEGIQQIRQGLASYRATGAEIAMTCWLGFLAEGLRKKGQTEEGLGVISEALAMSKRTGEQAWDAELYRLKGMLLLTPQEESQNVAANNTRIYEVEQCFLQAINIAHRQHAKFLELQATMSVSRLWQRQGKNKKAHKMLAKIYSWFTEGLDTVDLQEAKVLLQQLDR